MAAWRKKGRPLFQVELGNRRYQTLPMVLPTTLDIRCCAKSCCTLLSYCEYTPFSRRRFLAIGNESAPIQLAQCWFRLVIFNAKILIYFLK